MKNNNLVVQIGNSLVKLDSVISIEFSWNHFLNPTNRFCYNVEIVFENGYEQTYNCNKNQLYQLLLFLDEIEYFDGKYNLVDIEAFIDNIHQEYYDAKTFQKILDKSNKKGE